MNDVNDPDLDALDRAARVASDGLHSHVQRQVEPELMLASLPPVAPARQRGRLLAAAAVAALFIGSVAVLGDGPDGDERSRLELDEDGNKLPAPEPGMLTPLGPNDGRDSIQLPITVEPNVDLADGDKVTVTGPGFVPGERVGIVQCASEAGEGNGAAQEQRAGIDACNSGSVEYATADDEGVATGTFVVRRVLTTSVTGTVDCALDAQRCIVAMGALSDYDRSGGYGIAFRGGGEPIAIPSVTASPAEGLSDGDTVHVEGEGFYPGPVSLTQCSTDPSGCWTIGNEIRLSAEEVESFDLGPEYEGGYLGIGLVADDDGRISGDVQVWRFLPTEDPGSYIDCAVSRCSIRFSSDTGGTAPAPAAIDFAPGGPGPRPPAVAAAPTRDLEPGDEIVVRGAGFEPGAYYSISLCASPAGDPSGTYGCMSTDGEQAQIDDDGGFAQEFEVPDPDELAEMTATTMCAGEGDCGESTAPSPVELCDGVSTVCTIRVDAYRNDPTAGGPPQFIPMPITVTFRR